MENLVDDPIVSNIEAQAELILDQVITPAEKAQADSDVLSTSQAAWNSARLSLSKIAELDGELSLTAVRMAVGYLYHCTDETIRRRERVPLLITPGIEAQHPLLTFSYWKVAADARHLGDPLESALDIAWQIAGYHRAYGKRPSVRAVEGWVYRDGNDKAALVWRSRYEGIVTQLEKIKLDGYFADPDGKALAGYCQSLIQSYLDTGISPLNSKRKEKTNATKKEKK